MYKVVIIDDEAYILNQLISLLDWKDLGFEIAATFENSEEIFDYLENNAVDAILSDISMPYPSGLDIAEYCFKNFPDIPVILISGYRDFEYAQKAIKYNVFEYITKPISYDKFYNCIKSLYDKLTSQKLSKQNHFISLSSLPSFQEVFFDLIYGRISTIDNLRTALSELGLNDNAIYMPCALLSIHIDNFDEIVSQNDKHDINSIYNAICNLIPCETKSSHNMLIRYAHSTLEILIIKKDNVLHDDFETEIDIIRKNLEEILKLKTSMQISKTYSSLSDLVSQKDNAISSIPGEYNLVSNVMKYIESNYKNAITLDDIARHTAMSKGYFCSHYKTLAGESFITTLNKYRIERAKELLQNPKIKSSTVGHLVGYRNIQHFYRVFKTVTGYTPNYYQEQVTEKQ